MIDNKLYDPGVYITQRATGLYQTPVQQPNVGFAGLFNRGKFFIPTLIDKSKFQLLYGSGDQTFNTAYAVNKYLATQESATVLRVSHNESMVIQTGSNCSQMLQVKMGTSSVISIMANYNYAMSGSISGSNVTITPYIKSGSTFVAITGSNVTYSLIPSDANYIGKMIGYVPSTTNKMYVYSSVQSVITTGSSFTVSQSQPITFGSGNISFSNASTPYIVSQKMDGNIKQLFKVYHISDGKIGNKDVKITISNIVQPDDDYVTFSLLVRQFNDTDERPVILQRFDNLTLNPSDANYIEKRIGNTYFTFVNESSFTSLTSISQNQIKKNGEYPNLSNYIYVIASSDVKDGLISSDIKPFGFEGYLKPFASSYSMSGSYITSSLYNGSASEFDPRKCLGIDINSDIQLTYFDKVSTVVNDTAFNISDCTQNVRYKQGDVKFTVAFQGGFDGVDDRKPLNIKQNISKNNTYGFDFSTQSSSGTLAIKNALQLLSNKDQVNIQALIIPMLDIYTNKQICQNVIDFCQNRGDCMAYFNYAKKGTVISKTHSFDIPQTSYGACYYPYAKIKDQKLGKFIWLPPVCVIPQAIAKTNKNYSKWDAVAGEQQGVMSGIVQLEFTFDTILRALLQKNKVNPIASFNGSPSTIWGNLTLLKSKTPHPLDRVNARRAVCDIKKRATVIGRTVLFKYFTNSISESFKNELQKQIFYPNFVQGKIRQYEVITDSSVNTDQSIDNNELNAVVKLKLSKTIEFVKIGMDISNVNATFTQS